MAKVQGRLKDICLVRALMTLRGITVEDLAFHAGVQLENLTAWLTGAQSALAHRSYISVLSYLGITKDGLTGSHVQVWTMHAPRSFSEVQQEALRQIAPWLVGGQIAEITGDFQPVMKKVRAYAIRGKSFKIIVLITGGMRKPAELDSTMLPNIQPRTGGEHQNGSCHVDPLYWHAVRNSAITPSEFDDIFTGSYNEWSWNDVRLVARERGITPTAMAKWVLSRDPKDSAALAQINESMGGEAVIEGEAEVESEAASEAPAKNPRAPRKIDKVDKTLRSVPIPITRQH